MTYLTRRKNIHAPFLVFVGGHAIRKNDSTFYGNTGEQQAHIQKIRAHTVVASLAFHERYIQQLEDCLAANHRLRVPTHSVRSSPLVPRFEDSNDRKQVCFVAFVWLQQISFPKTVAHAQWRSLNRGAQLAVDLDFVEIDISLSVAQSIMCSWVILEVPMFEAIRSRNTTSILS